MFGPHPGFWLWNISHLFQRTLHILPMASDLQLAVIAIQQNHYVTRMVVNFGALHPLYLLFPVAVVTAIGYD